MDILSKFDEIVINNDNRITTEDRTFCENQQNIYNKAIMLLTDFQENFLKLSEEALNTCFESYREGYKIDISPIKYILSKYDLEKIINNLQENFISNICEYLKNKYSVKINHKKVFAKYEKDYQLHYNKILDEIFEGMEGCTFEEKAIKEIKEKALTKQDYDGWRKEWNYEIKGKTIKFRFNINDIKFALYFYDNNETKIINCYTHNKIDDYTSYENGNTNIKFHKAEYALDFAKRFLGYVEMTEEQKEKIVKVS
jgi:hypothetical protein